MAHALVLLIGSTLGGTAPLDFNAAASAGVSHEGTASDDRPLEIQSLVEELARPSEHSAQEKRREEEKKREAESPTAPGQVVELAKPAIEERPDKAKYASEYDTKVDHETRHHGREAGGAGGEQAAPPPSLPGQPGPAARIEPVGKGGRPGALALREPQLRATAGQRDRVVGADREGGTPPPGSESRRSVARTPGEEGDGRAPGAAAPPPGSGATFMPTREMMRQAIGRPGAPAAGSMDYLKDVDDGEGTALNSKKWKHAPFFNRIKRAVAEQWHPDLVYIRHDPNGNVYGVKDRVTVLRVELGAEGKLVGYTVVQPSGVDFLDDEAIDAFKRAAPFLNPPKELIEADGKIHFNFGFIFELSGHTAVKVFRH